GWRNWLTRSAQNRLSFGACGFESHSGHPKRAGQGGIERSRTRRWSRIGHGRARVATVDERKQWRNDLLLALYDEVAHGRLARVLYGEIASMAQVPDDESYKVADWLVSNGYAEWAALGGSMAITTTGISAAERLYEQGAPSPMPVVLSIEERGDVEAVIGE